MAALARVEVKDQPIMIWIGSSDQLNLKYSTSFGQKHGQAKSPDIIDHRTARVTHNRATLLTVLYIFSLFLPFFSKEPKFPPVSGDFSEIHVVCACLPVLLHQRGWPCNATQLHLMGIFIAPLLYLFKTVWWL